MEYVGSTMGLTGSAMGLTGSTIGLTSAAIGLTVGLGVSLVVAPAALHLLGFTKAGIAAGSLAARMMSLSAIANGGRVAAGSLVAIGQSLGAGGLPVAVKCTFATIGTLLGSIIGAVVV